MSIKTVGGVGQKLTKVGATGTTRTCLGLNQNGHFPAKCSVMIAMNLSKLPKIARWIMTGLVGGLLGSDVSSGPRYLRLNLSGSWKSNWIVAHWNERFSASLIVMSILGP